MENKYNNPEEKNKNDMSHEEKDNNSTLIFEHVYGNDNIVKAVSFDEGKKSEVLLYVMSEEQFEDLLPQSEKARKLAIQ